MSGGIPVRLDWRTRFRVNVGVPLERRPHWRGGGAIRHHAQLHVGQGPFYHHARGGYPADGEAAVVRADASYDVHRLGKVAGIAWQLDTPGRKYSVKSCDMRRFAGASQMAEVEAIVSGLEEAKEKRVRHVHVMTDAQTAVHYLAGTWDTEQGSYSYETRTRLEAIAKDFDSVQVSWVKTKPELKQVDKASRRAREAKMAEMEKRWVAFVDEMGKKMNERVTRTFRNGLAVYDWFVVKTNPPACSCKYWRMRGDTAVRNNPYNLPKLCKHIPAALKDEGLDATQAAEQFVKRNVAHYRATRSSVELDQVFAELAATAAPQVVVTVPLRTS